MRGFSMAQFKLQKPISQLFGALKSHFFGMFTWGRSEQLYKTRCFRNVNLVTSSLHHCAFVLCQTASVSSEEVDNCLKHPVIVMHGVEIFVYQPSSVWVRIAQGKNVQKFDPCVTHRSRGERVVQYDALKRKNVYQCYDRQTFFLYRGFLILAAHGMGLKRFITICDLPGEKGNKEKLKRVQMRFEIV